MHLVFVYGTLKEGFPNFDVNKGIRLAGDFYTQNRYSLYIVGDRHVPWLVVDGECIEGRCVDGDQGEDKASPIKGQVFSVDDDVLRDLDRLEAVDEPEGYQRMQLSLIGESFVRESLDDTDPQHYLLADVYVKTAEQFNQAQSKAEVKCGPLTEYTLEQAALYRKKTGKALL